MKVSASLAVAVFVCLVLFIPADVFAQCAMCKQSAESTLRSNPGSIARGLNSGILYLMAVPYLAILFIFRKQVLVLLKKIGARFSRA